MNWTGGRLQRHSGSKGNAAARQKQHFAKVQQDLRSKSRKKSPIRLSIFDHVIEDRRQARHGSSAVESHHSDRSHSIQRGRPQHILNLLYRHESDHIPQVEKPQHHRSVPIKRRAIPVPDDDLYNATPPPRPPRIKRDPSIELSQLGHYEKVDESLSEKRRKLLRKSDWVGVSIQRPVGIKFATSMIDENVGRRKKLTVANGARYQSRQSYITSPFANKRRRLYSPTLEEPRRGHQKTDVKISIEGKVVNPGVSSSSIGGRGASQKVGDRRRSYTELSDMMLLDGGDGTAPYGSKEHRRPFHDSPLRHIERALTPFRNRNSEALEPSEQDASSSVQRYNITDRLTQNNNEHSESSSSKFKSGRKRLLDHHSPRQCHKISSIYEDEATFVVSSHPSSIHQPVPLDSRKSRLLQPESIENYGSTVAHIGENPLVVPRSQQLQNDIWASWVALESEDDYNGKESNDYDQGVTQRVSISPGISTIFAGRQTARLSRISVQSSPLESPAPNEDDKNENDENKDDDNEPAQLGLSNDIAEENDEIREDVQQETTNTARTFSPFLQFQRTKTADDNNAVPQRIQENTDELWRKFVFGDGSDSSDEVDAVDLPRLGFREGYQALEYADLSTAGQTSTETFPTSRAQQGGSDSQVATTQLSRSSSFSGYVDRIPVVTSSISLKTIQRQKTLQRQEARQSLRNDDRIFSYNSRTHPNTGSSKINSAAGLASPLVSMVSHARLFSSSRVSGTGLATSSGQTKVLFTKPKPFKGRKSDLPQEEEPLYIGRPFSLKDRLAQFELKKEKRRGRDIYVLDESEEDVESIEDD